MGYDGSSPFSGFANRLIPVSRQLKSRSSETRETPWIQRWTPDPVVLPRRSSRDDRSEASLALFLFAHELTNSDTRLLWEGRHLARHERSRTREMEKEI